MTHQNWVTERIKHVRPLQLKAPLFFAFSLDVFSKVNNTVLSNPNMYCVQNILAKLKFYKKIFVLTTIIFLKFLMQCLMFLKTNYSMLLYLQRCVIRHYSL